MPRSKTANLVTGPRKLNPEDIQQLDEYHRLHRLIGFLDLCKTLVDCRRHSYFFEGYFVEVIASSLVKGPNSNSRLEILCDGHVVKRVNCMNQYMREGADILDLGVADCIPRWRTVIVFVSQ